MKHVCTLKRPCLAAGLLLLLLIMPGPAARAQAPVWQSAITTPGTSVVVRAAAADANGNLILVGNFSGTATFGTATFTATLTDGFIAKWNPGTSRFIWAQQITGPGSEYARSLAINGTSIYVGGVYGGRMAFIGSTVLTNLDSFGNNDLFIARLTDAGATSSFDWAIRAGGQGSEDLTGLALNGSSLYVVGSFSGATTTTFGSTTLPNASSSLGPNVYLARLTDNGGTGSFDWARAAGGNQATAVAVSGPSVYVTGSYQGANARFGSITLPPAAGTDMFVAKLTDAGSNSGFTWVQAAGGTGSEQANALVANGTALYVAGYFSSPTLALGSSSLSSAGSSDVFVAKLSDGGLTGSFVWAQAAGGIGAEVAQALAVSGPNVYVTGYFGSAPANFGSTALSSTDPNDVFVAKLRDSGFAASFAWAQAAGGTGFDEGLAVVVQSLSVYVAGLFNSPSISFGSNILPRPGPGFALFLAALTDPILTATAARSGFHFTLAPNPAHGTASVTLPAVPGATTASLTLLDALGRAVRTRPATPGTRTELDLAGLAPGLYALRATAGAATTTKRLVVE